MKKATRYFIDNIDVTDAIMRNETPVFYQPRYHEIRVIEVWVKIN